MSTPDSPPLPQDLPQIRSRISDWFFKNGRDLPWRTALPTSKGCSPWGIMISEFMLQQTPVIRVLPRWEEWMDRWPTPADLAAEPSGEAVRAWGRLGYPRRALRLHAAAQAIVADHDAEVPDTREALLSLPGVGAYTSAAIAAFAFGRRENVVDTNIRRVHARLVSGKALPSPSYTRAEEKLSESLLPADAAESVTWNAAVMELGALVCTARSPKCGECPVASSCAWLAAGSPEPEYVPKGQAWHGTDRQVRGAIMAVLRASRQGVPRELFTSAPDFGPVDLHLDPETATGAATRAAQPGTKGTTAPTDSVLVLLDTFHALKAPQDQVLRALTGLLKDHLISETEGLLGLPA